ncbi:MAG: hypothetical protein ACOC2B_06255, partial [Sediminispirochaetaceae bacterium]
MNAGSAFDGEPILAAESIEKSFGGSSSGGSSFVGSLFGGTAASRSAPLKVLEKFSISVHTGEFVT